MARPSQPSGDALTELPPLYRMPVCFGPMPGPRESPNAPPLSPKRQTCSFVCPSDEARISAILPPEMRAIVPLEVIFDVTFLSDLGWLAGGGYAMFGCRVAVSYAGPQGDTRGYFLAVLFEDLADPILSGREELGYAKLFCDIELDTSPDGEDTLTCAWRDHTFATFTFADPNPSTTPVTSLEGGKGLLHHRYFPATGQWGKPLVSEAALSPVTPGETEVTARDAGRGSLTFTPGAWSDLPTLYHVVSGIEALVIGTVTRAERWGGVGMNAQADQVILGPITPPGSA